MKTVFIGSAFETLGSRFLIFVISIFSSASIPGFLVDFGTRARAPERSQGGLGEPSDFGAGW